MVERRVRIAVMPVQLRLGPLDFMKKIIIILFLWLAVVNIFALLALNRFNLASDTAYRWINPTEFFQTKTWNLVSLHARWDSFWYLDVAKNGYSFKGPGQLSNPGFFPLYPFSVRAVAFLLGGDFILAGWILSVLFLLLAMIYFAKLVREFHKEINCQLPIILLLVFPTAFFLNAVYAEPLLLFLSIAGFYYGLKRNFLLAGIFGGLAALTKITGLFIFIPLLWEYFQSNGFRVFKARFFSLLLIPLATLSYFLYHYFKFGDFFLYLKLQSWWGRTFSFNKEHFLLFSNPAKVNFFIDLAFVLVGCAATYSIFKRLRFSYGLYAAITIFVPLSTGTFMSMGRYVLMLFPIYILIAGIKNYYVKGCWMLASVLFLALDIILFVNNYWAG